MLKVYQFMKYCFLFNFIQNIYLMIMHDFTWLVGVNVLLLAFYMWTIFKTKGKRQVTQVLISYYLMCPIDLVLNYRMYHDRLLIGMGVIVFMIVAIYLHVVREQIEYL